MMVVHVSETSGGLSLFRYCQEPAREGCHWIPGARTSENPCVQSMEYTGKATDSIVPRPVGPIQLYLVKIADVGSRCQYSRSRRRRALFFGTAFVLHVDCMRTK